MGKVTLILVCVGFAATRAAASISVIDTSTPLTSNATTLGEPNTATYGQTFTVVAPHTWLNSFSFRFEDLFNGVDGDPDVVDFEAYVYAWDSANNRAVGSWLYKSAMRSSTNNGVLGSEGGEEQFDFHTGGVLLNAGQKYVAFLTTSNAFDGLLGRSRWQVSDANVYSGGEAVFLNNGNNFAQITTSTWQLTASGRDTWFMASLSDRPLAEPASALTFAGLAACFLAGAWRKRSRRPGR